MANEHEALAALDRALQQKPKKDGPDFAHAMMGLVALRQRLTARLRDGEDVAAPLGRVNAVISVVLGAHFPLGDIHWDSVARARDTLAELIAAQPTRPANTAR